MTASLDLYINEDGEEEDPQGNLAQLFDLVVLYMDQNNDYDRNKYKKQFIKKFDQITKDLLEIPMEL